jgi:hypothetical protein
MHSYALPFFSDDRKDGILEVGEELSGDEADPDYTEYMTGKKIPLGRLFTDVDTVPLATECDRNFFV